jgi:hypothetical protein
MAEAKSEVKETTPELLPLKQSQVVVNTVGHCNKSVVVHVPDNVSLQQIMDTPSIFRNVQTSRTCSLNEGDEVQLRWLDMFATALVDAADHETVTLTKPTIIRRREKDRVPWANDVYEVRAFQGQYTYYRKRDGIRMAPVTWATWQAARDACIRDQAPARV